MQLLLACVLIAGIVRGFSGFGTGMIVSPVVAALYSPKAALIVIFLIDSWPMLFIAVPAWRQVERKELLPVVGGYALILPLGIVFVSYSDPVFLRWFISLTIFVLIAVLWSGWHYQGRRTAPISLSVGGVCGFLGGSTALAGPPAILYWLAARKPAMTVRANMTVMLALTGMLAGFGYWLSGFFTRDAVIFGLAASPVYLGGLLVGTKMFSNAGETVYRMVAYVIIIAAALISLPILDGVANR